MLSITRKKHSLQNWENAERLKTSCNSKKRSLPCKGRSLVWKRCSRAVRVERIHAHLLAPSDFFSRFISLSGASPHAPYAPGCAHIRGLAKGCRFVYTLICNNCFSKLRNKCFLGETDDDKHNRKTG